MSLDLEGEHQVIKEKIADKLDMSIEEAAWGIHQIANENMANAVRVHALEQGKDPRRFPLFAFGGAGPVHGYRIARSLGSPSLLAPLGAGVMSTVGFLTAPLAFDFVRSWAVELDALDWMRANELVAEMEAEGQAILTGSGVSNQEIAHRREVDMRYVGQGHEIRVPLSAGHLNRDSLPTLVAELEQVYQELYERLGPPVPIEILNWRVTSTGPRPDVQLQMNAESDSESVQSIADTIKGERLTYFPEANGFISTPIYDRYRLKPGMKFAGPAIVEERESTAIIGPNSQCYIDHHHNLIVSMPSGVLGFVKA